jgi:heme-degrading monooxygenase HmoA
MYARVTNIRFAPTTSAEVVRVAHGFAPILKKQRGFNGLDVLTDTEEGEGVIVSKWETEADAEASEASPSYINQMSMMSSFLYAPLAPRTYAVSVQA